MLNAATQIKWMTSWTCSFERSTANYPDEIPLHTHPGNVQQILNMLLVQQLPPPLPETMEDWLVMLRQRHLTRTDLGIARCVETKVLDDGSLVNARTVEFICFASQGPVKSVITHALQYEAALWRSDSQDPLFLREPRVQER